MKCMYGGKTKGAGLAAMALSSLKTLSPIHWHQKIKQYKENTSAYHDLNEYEQEMAQLAKHSYQDKNSRSHYKNYTYQQELSSDGHAVYRNDKTNKNYLVFKGTSNSQDIIPDTAIMSGYQNLNQSFKNGMQTYQNVQSKLPGTWETVVHSLGGTKAMYVAQQQGIDSHAFNPGYNNYADDQIQTNYKGHHVYVREGDAISNTILTEKLEHLKLLPSLGWSPLQNHTINNFPTST